MKVWCCKTSAIDGRTLNVTSKISSFSSSPSFLVHFFPQTSLFRAHFTLFLLSRGSCINLSLHTLKNVVRRRRRETEKKTHVLKYFSPPPATEKRPRVPVSLQPHASTTHLFMEEEEEEEDSKKGRYEEDRGRKRYPPLAKDDPSFSL